MSRRKPIRLRGLDKLNAQMATAEDVVQNSRRILRGGDLVNLVFEKYDSSLEPYEKTNDLFLVDSVSETARVAELRGKSLVIGRKEVRYWEIGGVERRRVISIEILARSVQMDGPLIRLLQYLFKRIKNLEKFKQSVRDLVEKR